MNKSREKEFLAMKAAIESNKVYYTIIKFIYKVLPFIILVGYPLLVIYLVIMWDLRFVRVVTVPTGTFIAVTIIRYILNKPRPYERMNITPLFPKTTKGKSFPSRHTASTVIISFAFLYINIPLGICAFVISFFIVAIRPLVGVHFVSDVVAGGIISTVFGIVFFFLI